MKPRLLVAKLAKRLKRTWSELNAARELSRWKQKQGDIRAGRADGVVDVAALGLSERGLTAVREQLSFAREVVIAEIDEDGFYLSRFGPIDGLPCVDELHFQHRKKFSIELVAIGGAMGVRKTYERGNLLFLNELKALAALKPAGCNVPAILDVNCEDYSLTTAWIPGAVLREALAARGAIVRDRDVIQHPDFPSAPQVEHKEKRIEQGRRYLREVVDDRFIERAFQEMRKIHAAGFRINDIKYGNVIIERDSGDPYFIDFEGADDLRGLGRSLADALFDRDIQRFNQHFGTNKPTAYA
jgi:hypothetical protein